MFLICSIPSWIVSADTDVSLLLPISSSLSPFQIRETRIHKWNIWATSYCNNSSTNQKMVSLMFLISSFCCPFCEGNKRKIVYWEVTAILLRTYVHLVVFHSHCYYTLLILENNNRKHIYKYLRTSRF